MSYPYQITSLEEYHETYARSIADPISFWAEIASHFQWHKAPKEILNWDFKDYRVEWFRDGQLNITENLLDRHLKDRGDQVAIIWEPNEIDTQGKTFTYQELYDRVCAFCHVLKARGVGKGDRVCIYMSMVPELAIAVLACARIGAIHSVIFGGFSAQSIADRVNDAQAKMIITQDEAYRGNKILPLKPVVDEALKDCSSIESVIVYRHTHGNIEMMANRDYDWYEELEKVKQNGAKEYPAEIMNAEDPLFILYTSGSTGKPKGVVHACGGYMVYSTYSFVNVFQYKEGDVYFCTADIGWITGHSYLIYGPLSAGATTIMFEGVPTYPDAGRFWDIIDRYQVNIFYTAPTAIRSLMASGLEQFENKKLDSLRVLGTVGEPINEEAWKWYYEHVGKNRCPIVDTWWQTETGGIMISNLAGITPHIPAHATWPLPGIQPVLMNENGQPIAGSDATKSLPLEIVNGNLCIQYPWPSMIRTTWGDHERCKQTYFTTYENMYFTGDGCFRDEHGYYRITGRVDDVLNVSGHRIGTAEVENAINSHPGVVESAIVGYPHEIKGQGIYAYVIVNDRSIQQDEIRSTVARIIGAIAKPDKIQFVSGLPKTRSGKIMRRILRKIAEGEIENLGDTTTLLDPNVVTEILQNRL